MVHNSCVIIVYHSRDEMGLMLGPSRSSKILHNKSHFSILNAIVSVSDNDLWVLA
jgi:hypothetical protein